MLCGSLELCGFEFSRDENPLFGASRSPLREWPTRRHAPRSLNKAFYVFVAIAPYWGATTDEGMTDTIVTHFLHGDTAFNIVYDERDGALAEWARLKIDYFPSDAAAADDGADEAAAAAADDSDDYGDDDSDCDDDSDDDSDCDDDSDSVEFDD